MDAQTLLQMIDIWCQWNSAFGEHATELRDYFTAHPDTLQAIMLHMLTSRGKRPTKKWLREWQEMKTRVPTPLLRPLLMGLAAKQEWYMGLASEADTSALVALESGQPIPPESGHTSRTLTTAGSAVYASNSYQRWRKEGGIWYERFGEFDMPRTRKRAIAKAACWALADFCDAEARELLMQHIRAKLLEPALWTMAQWGDDITVARLLQMTRLTTRQKLLDGIEEALTAIAVRRGLQVGQLKDLAVLTHDLNAQGERTWTMGADSIRLAISPGGRAVRRVKRAGRDDTWQRNLPSDLRAEHEETWKAVAHEAKLLSITLSMQKRRMESAMRERRSWSWEEWQEAFAHHPVSGHFARRLIWAISAQDGTHINYAIYNEQGKWHTADGAEVQPENQHRLYIVHPVEMRPEDHSRWQRYVVTTKLVQPFKQMFRETYMLTPAEEQTRTYSNRFASHLIPPDQFSALRRAQDWKIHYQVSLHEFQSHAIRAHIWYKSEPGHHQALQQIAFYRVDHAPLWSRPRLDLDPACLPLSDIPAIVFSETMHDIDQYLVSASRGTDQNWDEDSPRRWHNAYDNQPPHRREQLLHELLPLLDLGDIIQIKGRCAYINGKHCEYRVDLGNGTIYIEPMGRYLCIVPRYTAKDTQKLYLPFEDNDPKTTEIISKILLLARDETITDASILRQLPTRKTVWA